MRTISGGSSPSLDCAASSSRKASLRQMRPLQRSSAQRTAAQRSRPIASAPTAACRRCSIHTTRHHARDYQREPTSSMTAAVSIPHGMARRCTDLPAGAEEDLRDANLVVRTAQAEGHHQSLHRDRMVCVPSFALSVVRAAKLG